MRLTPLRRSLAGSAAVAAVALFALAGTASATPGKPVLVSGDDRAVAYDRNVDIEHDDACKVGGLTGTTIAPGEFTFTGGKNKLDLDITAAPPNVTVTGVVVKGSNAYNVYLADKLGALPWNDLRAPQNKGDNVPEISHWYACGIATQEPPKEEPPAEQPPKEQPPAEQPPKVEQPPSSTVAPSSSAPTSTPAPAPAGAEELAETGFGSAWLLGVGGALVAAGAAVLLVLRRRRA